MEAAPPAPPPGVRAFGAVEARGPVRRDRRENDDRPARTRHRHAVPLRLWRIEPGGRLILTVSRRPLRHSRHRIPRIGLRMSLPSYSAVSYIGRGPGEDYPDSCRANLLAPIRRRCRR